MYSIWPVITIYSNGMQFDDVKGAYCRIYDDKTGSEFVRYSLSENMDNISDGCIVASLNRHDDNDSN